MTRQHVADGEIDVAIIDAPFFLRVPPEQCVTDYYLELNGEKPRFRAGLGQLCLDRGVRRVL